VTAPYDYSALWLKAKLFLNHAMDEKEPRSYDERALWAALALELLAKAALARVSPLLVAAPTEDGTNLLIASGLVAGDARFNSVKARTLYSRCHKAFKPFNEREAQAITNARNEYLHGSGVGVTGIPPAVWWPKFWAQASILVNALDKTTVDLVGPERAAIVETHLAQNKQNVAHRLEMLIARARQRLAQHQSGDLPARVAAEWARPVHLEAGLSHRSAHACPACGASGVLEGEYIDEAEPRYEQTTEDNYDAWMELTVAADHFSCETCRLVLDTYELLEEAGLPSSFEDTGDMADYMEPDYGND
jgi:hypothetical protein